MTWANQIRILKQNFEQLGSVVGRTLINALKPLVQALNVVMVKFIAFAETVSNALGKIFGWKYESASGGAGLADDMEDAAGSADDIADSTGTAADNIKKMQAGLRAFDELKTINLPDNSSNSGSGSGSGSGSSGSSSSASGSSGQWVRQDSMFEDYQSSINSLHGLGNYIRDALIGAMESINWDSIYEKARGFGAGLASFLNGLFAGNNGETLFGALGTTIAGALNTVLHGLDSFGRTFDWTQFGSSIADGVNNFFSTFDFALLADTINTWADGILNACISFVDSTNWEQIGGKISEFLSNIDYGKLLADAIELSVSLINAAESFAKGIVKNFDPIKILKSIKDGLATVDWSEAFDAFTDLALLIPGINLSFAALDFLGVKDKIVDLIDTIENIDFKSWFEKDVKPWFAKEKWVNMCKPLGKMGEWFNTNVIKPVSDFFKGLCTSVSGFFGGLWEGIKGIWTTVSTWFKDNVTTPVSNVFNGVCTRIGQFFQGCWLIVQATWGVVSTWFNNYVITPISTIFSGVCTRIGQFFDGCWLIVQATWKVVSTWFNDNVTTPIKTKFGEVKTKITTAFSTAKSNVIGTWQGIKTWFSDTVIAPVKTLFESVKTKITTAFSTAKSNVIGVWKGVKKWFSDTVIDPVKNAFKTACDKIGGFFDSLWKGVKKGVATAFNVVISNIESAINGIVSGINKMLSGFNAVAKKAGEIVGKDYSGVAQIPKVSLPRIKGYEAGGFPQRYSLFMAGENGIPEIAGTVGGKTAVAGGAEITGIRDAIYTSSQQEMRLLQEQNQLLREILNKQFGITQNDIGRAAQGYAREQFDMTGESVFVF